MHIIYACNMHAYNNYNDIICILHRAQMNIDFVLGKLVMQIEILNFFKFMLFKQINIVDISNSIH
jgi:hypothetical protein